MNNIMTELQAALRELGHGAEEVQDAPTDMLNVWLDDQGRTPSATVLYEPVSPTEQGQIVWGHHWEHQSTTSVGAEELARRVVATCQ
jgi:hypothetical protein